MKGTGLRVDYSELGGLFSKRVRPNRYLRLRAVRSGSGGLDLNAGRSNLSHRKWIRRPGRFGRVGAARLAGNASPAAAHRRRSPDPAFPGSETMRSGSGGDYATHVVHLRLLRASGRRAAGRAASTAALRSGARRRGAFGVLQGLRPNKTSTKGA